jgi:Zn finger protein HypA/HybF involved in hydrogenase expression
MPINPFINFHGSPASGSGIIVAPQEGGDVMGVEFNFNEKSFEKKLRKEVKKNALNASYDFTCPKCGAIFKAQVGKNVCPKCGTEIELKPDSSWNKL